MSKFMVLLPMELILILLITVAVQSAVAADVLVSPLFGLPGRGDPFDDGTTTLIPCVTHVSAISLCLSSEDRFSIQLTYMLEDNKTYTGPVHGVCPNESEKHYIKFKEGEILIRIEVQVNDNNNADDTHGIGQLTFFALTKEGVLSSYGPYGSCWLCKSFSMAGTVVGIFGESSSLLNAMGVYILNSALPPSLYNKTALVGHVGEDDVNFDDIFGNEQPSKITSMKIVTQFIMGGAAGMKVKRQMDFYNAINGFQVTYSFPSGATSTVTHGYVELDSSLIQSVGILDFADTEWITQVDLSLGNETFHEQCIKIVTMDSKGSVETYGPFVKECEPTISVHGVVRGFYGYTGDPAIPRASQLSSLGFYTS